MSETQLVKREREYYEKSYLEFMRFKIPKTEDFIEFVNTTLKNADYIITDHLSPLTKDTKCCLLNYLNIYDICRLAMTCKEYSKVTNNPTYDDYWRNRFKKAFPEYYVDNNGVFTYRREIRSILWFDAYQYIIIRSHKSAERHNRRTFHTFVKWKRQSKFPQSFKNDIQTSRWSTKSQIMSEFKLSIDTNLLKEIDYQYDFKKSENDKRTEVLYKNLCRAIYSYMGKNFRSCKTVEQLNQIKEDYDENKRNPRQCLIIFDDEFLKKWGFSLDNYKCKCLLPHKSYYSKKPMETIDDIYDSCLWKQCVEQIINGPTLKPLEDELKKYKINLYSSFYQ